MFMKSDTTQRPFCTALGILFILLGGIGLIIHITHGVWPHFFWFSNHWALLNGIAFLFGSRLLFSHTVILGIVPETLWIIDLFVKLSGHTFLGITDYLFIADYSPVLTLLALQHLINPAAAVYGLQKYGFHPRTLLAGLTHGVLLLIAGRLFPAAYNVNCAHHNCITALPISDLTWHILWPVLITVQMIIVYGLLRWRAPTQQ